MDLIFKETKRSADDLPVLQQMEVRFASLQLYALRFTWVWATSLTAARAIQRQWRASQH